MSHRFKRHEASGANALSWRRMRSDDLQRVLQIERNTQPVPWSRLAFEESLTRSEEESVAPYYCRVLDSADNREQLAWPGSQASVLAFFVLSSVTEELHIMNLAVAPRAQGMGLGHAMMNEILRVASVAGVTRVLLEVRASNQIAASLYRKWGFQQIAIRKDYYRTSQGGEKEDALIYCNQLTNTVNT